MSVLAVIPQIVQCSEYQDALLAVLGVSVCYQPSVGIALAKKKKKNGAALPKGTPASRGCIKI
jgi:hypothetical protein